MSGVEEDGGDVAGGDGDALVSAWGHSASTSGRPGAAVLDCHALPAACRRHGPATCSACLLPSCLPAGLPAFLPSCRPACGLLTAALRTCPLPERPGGGRLLAGGGHAGLLLWQRPGAHLAAPGGGRGAVAGCGLSRGRPSSPRPCCPIRAGRRLPACLPACHHAGEAQAMLLAGWLAARRAGWLLWWLPGWRAGMPTLRPATQCSGALLARPSPQPTANACAPPPTRTPLAGA